jgi:hypothetical protein
MRLLKPHDILHAVDFNGAMAASIVTLRSSSGVYAGVFSAKREGDTVEVDVIWPSGRRAICLRNSANERCWLRDGDSDGNDLEIVMGNDSLTAKWGDRQDSTESLRMATNGANISLPCFTVGAAKCLDTRVASDIDAILHILPLLLSPSVRNRSLLTILRSFADSDCFLIDFWRSAHAAISAIPNAVLRPGDPRPLEVDLPDFDGVTPWEMVNGLRCFVGDIVFPRERWVKYRREVAAVFPPTQFLAPNNQIIPVGNDNGHDGYFMMR